MYMYRRRFLGSFRQRLCLLPSPPESPSQMNSRKGRLPWSCRQRQAELLISRRALWVKSSVRKVPLQFNSSVIGLPGCI